MGGDGRDSTFGARKHARRPTRRRTSKGAQNGGNIKLASTKPKHLVVIRPGGKS